MRMRIGSRIVAECDSCRRLITGKRSVKRERCPKCHRGRIEKSKPPEALQLDLEAAIAEVKRGILS